MRRLLNRDEGLELTIRCPVDVWENTASGSVTINISPLTRQVKCINNSVTTSDTGHSDAAATAGGGGGGGGVLIRSWVSSFTADTEHYEEGALPEIKMSDCQSW